MSHAEYARFFRADDLAPLECLDARYRSRVFVPHFHEEYVVNTLVAGAQGYRYRGRTHEATRGTLILIEPGEVHTGHARTPAGWAYRGFYPSVTLIRQLAAAISGVDGVTPVFSATTVDDPELATRLDGLHQLLSSSTDALRRESAIVAVFGDVIRRHMAVRERHAPGCHRSVMLMRQVLADRLTENVSLRELADLTGHSVWHASRLFAREAGLPPVAWRNQLRVQRARAALARGESIAAVAQAVGFADQAQLTRVFRASMGATPGAYRRAMAGH